MPFEKEQITYLKPGHPDPDSLAYSLIAAVTVSALKTRTLTHKGKAVRPTYRYDLSHRMTSACFSS